MSRYRSIRYNLRKERLRSGQLKKHLLTAAVLITAIFILALTICVPAAARAKSGESVIIYTSVRVEPGDNLTLIADRYMGDSYSSRAAYIKEVCRINHLSRDRIQAGAYLVVPYSKE